MKFNLMYPGPEQYFHPRRDVILPIKFVLEALGHAVYISGPQLESSCFNIILGGYFLPGETMRAVAKSGIRFAVLNSEITANDMLNFNPKKVDFMNDYLPFMKAGKFIWDLVPDNLADHRRHGNNAHLIEWGWHPKAEEVQHYDSKDLDFYFFGSLTERRKRLLQKLVNAGLNGYVDHSCPYFVRNDRIGRAKVQVNLTQTDNFTHINGIRICYLANNRCCIISEKENDPANYLEYAELVSPETLVDKVKSLLADDHWKTRGEEAYEALKRRPMKEKMEQLLEKSFAGN